MAATRYGQIRNQLFQEQAPSGIAPTLLRDADSNYVPIPISERLVQCIWFDQRLAAGPLTTTEGRPVRVIFPGWWNLERGPDFHHATIQIGAEPARTGAIEIHLRADDWFHHRHDHDPLYQDVILHVVLWSAGSHRAPRGIPQIVLEHQLAAPLEQLHDEIDLEAYPHNAAGHGGQCSQILPDLPADKVRELLAEAGDERFLTKTRRFTRWLQRTSPEQTFYEGWMEALGYKANKQAFRTLAQRTPVTLLDGQHLAPLLFGLANFLPRTAGGDAYAKRLWSRWWKLRPDYEEQILPLTAWRLHGIRPANHPHRRLGAAVALLKRHPNLMEKVIGAIESDGDPAKLFANIRDDYWSRHFTLAGKAQAKDTELIGAARATEIVTNIILPFAAALAEQRGDPALVAQVKSRYAGNRPAPSNSILRLAGQQLFAAATTARKFTPTARHQQGLIQIFQDFCLNDKSACANCQFPELVRRWNAG